MSHIVALTNNSAHSWIILNAVVERFGPVTVLTEEKEDRKAVFRRRARRNGVVATIGQTAFLVLYRTLLLRLSRRRVAELTRDLDLDPRPNAACTIIPVDSVNGEACRDALKRLAPKVVLVFGTRLLKPETLDLIHGLVLNFHSGLTPKYRGQAGGYWALAQGDLAHAGVTVHLIDAGVDSGAVVHQARFAATKRDSFPTYFYLQAAALRDLAIRAVEEALRGDLRFITPDLPSKLYFHPTIWGYFWTGLAKGVW